MKHVIYKDGVPALRGAVRAASGEELQHILGARLDEMLDTLREVEGAYEGPGFTVEVSIGWDIGVSAPQPNDYKPLEGK